MIEQQPTVLSLSDAAALKLRELTKEETNPNIGLRVYVYSGGCSGFRYGMMLEDQPTPEDNVLEANGVKVGKLRMEKGSVWAFETRNGRVTKASYLPPPKP